MSDKFSDRISKSGLLDAINRLGYEFSIVNTQDTGYREVEIVNMTGHRILVRVNSIIFKPKYKPSSAYRPSEIEFSIHLRPRLGDFTIFKLLPKAGDNLKQKLVIKKREGLETETFETIDNPDLRENQENLGKAFLKFFEEFMTRDYVDKTS